LITKGQQAVAAKGWAQVIFQEVINMDQQNNQAVEPVEIFNVAIHQDDVYGEVRSGFC
jgi:hypothetical protein